MKKTDSVFSLFRGEEPKPCHQISPFHLAGRISGSLRQPALVKQLTGGKRCIPTPQLSDQEMTKGCGPPFAQVDSMEDKTTWIREGTRRPATGAV